MEKGVDELVGERVSTCIMGERVVSVTGVMCMSDQCDSD